MAQELTSPTNEQFVTLKKTPEVLTAVFRATGQLRCDDDCKASVAGRKSGASIDTAALGRIDIMLAG